MTTDIIGVIIITMNTKTIAISLEVYNYLKGKGAKGESFDTILRRLLNLPNQTIPPQVNPYLASPIQTKSDRPRPNHTIPNSEKPNE